MNITGQVQVTSTRAELRGLLSRQIAPLCGLALVTALLWHSLQSLDTGAVLAAFEVISVTQWALAASATAVSFWAVGRMEVVLHRVLDTGAPRSVAQTTGMAAVALSQFAGFGLLTGTLARWRLVPGLGIVGAAKVTALMSVTFMVALGILTACAVLLVRPELPWAKTLALLGLLALLSLVGVTIWKPRLLIRVSMPPIKAQLRILAWTLVDTLAAAATLYLLLPAQAWPNPLIFYTAYVLALGSGLLGSTPGGVGPFEFVLLLSLPALPEAEVLAAVMAYRIVFFAAPACQALLMLVLAPLLPFAAKRTPCAHVEPLAAGEWRPIAALAFSYTAARAEAGLIRQGEFDLLVDRQDQALSLVAPTGQSLIMLADPLKPSLPARPVLDTLRRAARRMYLAPCLYKCDAGTAVQARRAGWRVQRVSEEAILCPTRFDEGHRAYRQLRRFLRKAEAAGVTVQDCSSQPPQAELRQIAEAWGADRKRRGFSMGLFDEAYVSGQRIFLARHGGRAIAFVTFHENWREWGLDLICHLPDTPPGTNHLLIRAALGAAAAIGVERLSLAAVPQLGEHLPGPAWLRAKVTQASGAPGLRRFKGSFAPRWEPLYMAAPTQFGLFLGAIDLVDRITRPRQALAPPPPRRS